MELVSSDMVREDSSPAWSAGEVEFDVLRTLWAERSALTRRQLQVRTGLPVGAVTEAVGRLCASGRLLRLKTLVESFALPAWTVDRPVPGSVVLSSPAQGETVKVL